MKIVKADSNGIESAVNYLTQGKAVVYPTDTAYGLGVDATNLKAVKQLYKIKGRSFKKPVHVVVSGLAMAKKYAKFDRVTEKLFKKFLPGPLTLVLESRIWNMEYGKILSAGSDTLGIRMPDNRIALALVKKLGRPITTTSANLSGGPTPYAVADSISQFKNKKQRPDLYLDAGRLPPQKPSTIVKVSKDKIKILRKGPIGLRKIQTAIK